MIGFFKALGAGLAVIVSAILMFVGLYITISTVACGFDRYCHAVPWKWGITTAWILLLALSVGCASIPKKHLAPKA